MRYEVKRNALRCTIQHRQALETLEVTWSIELYFTYKTVELLTGQCLSHHSDSRKAGSLTYVNEEIMFASPGELLTYSGSCKRKIKGHWPLFSESPTRLHEILLVFRSRHTVGLDKKHVQYSWASRFSCRASRFHRSLARRASAVENFHGSFDR